MSIRNALFASVCTALLAASAAVPGAQAASADKLADQSYRALAEGRAADAIAGYTELLGAKKLSQDARANALLNRGLAYQQAASFAEAIADYSQAIDGGTLNPQFKPTAYYNRGLAQQKLGNLGPAVEDFTSALFEQPDFSHAYYARGNALRDAGQLLFALSDFEKALHYKYPHQHLVYYSEALAYQELRRPDAAAKSLQQALALKPDFAAAKKLLAELGAGAVPSNEAKAAVEPAGVIVVGSINRDGPDQVLRKKLLPKAVKPPEEFTAETKEPEAAPAETAEVTGSIDPAKEPEVKPRKKKLITLRIEPTEGPPKRKALVKREDKPAAAEDDPVADADPAPAATGGWSVQISSAKEEDFAWGTWKKLKARHEILADQKPAVVKADLGQRGIYYRLKLQGFAGKAAAKSMCARLKAKGVSCILSNPEG